MMELLIITSTNLHIMDSVFLIYLVHVAKLGGQSSVCIVSLVNSSSNALPFLTIVTSIIAAVPVFHILAHLLCAVSLVDSVFLAYICLW